MIFRRIKFQVVYRNGEGGFSREEVVELKQNAEFGIYAVKTVTDFELELDPLNVALFQFAGQFDKDGNEVYHGSLLAEANGAIHEVVSYNGGFYLDRETPLTDALMMKMKVVGDAVFDTHLMFDEDTGQKALDESKKRNAPPLVTLKKKTL